MYFKSHRLTAPSRAYLATEPDGLALAAELHDLAAARLRRGSTPAAVRAEMQADAVRMADRLDMPEDALDRGRMLRLVGEIVAIAAGGNPDAPRLRLIGADGVDRGERPLDRTRIHGNPDPHHRRPTRGADARA